MVALQMALAMKPAVSISHHVVRNSRTFLKKTHSNAIRQLTQPTLRRRRVINATPVAVALPALAPVMPSLLGGLSIGVLAVSKLIVSGRILGISGSVKGLVKGDKDFWSWLFIIGLVTGGVFLQTVYPSAVEALPADTPLSRIIFSGLAVGFGTSIGSGCTSGHGICGLARCSPRSFISVLTFMMSGAVAAAAFRSAALFHIPAGLVALSEPPAELLMLAKAVLAASVGLLGSLFISARALIKTENEGECRIAEDPAAVWLDRFANLAIGVLFALSLGVSGMAQPSKVTGFLSIFSGSFDYSLMFVMGGALLVATPVFQLVIRTRMLQRPLCVDEYSLPKAKKIDWKLVLGAAIFGMGWGTMGICPGPGLVSASMIQLPILAWVASMMTGSWVGQEFEKAQERAMTEKLRNS